MRKNYSVEIAVRLSNLTITFFGDLFLHAVTLKQCQILCWIVCKSLFKEKSKQKRIKIIFSVTININKFGTRVSIVFCFIFKFWGLVYAWLFVLVFFICTVYFPHPILLYNVNHLLVYLLPLSQEGFNLV